MTAKMPEKSAKPSKDVIYLDVDDEITAIIDKVEAAKHKIIALVLPKRFATLQSVVNMRLLKRGADKVGKNVVLITSEAALLPLAGAAGLHVAKNLQSQPAVPPSPLSDKEDLPEEAEAPEPEADLDQTPSKIDYAKPIGELAAAHEIEEPETIPLDDTPEEPQSTKKPAKAKKAKSAIPNFDRFRLLLGLGIAGLVLLVIFIILAMFVWPKATIAIQTTSTPIAANFDLTTSGSAKQLDSQGGIIPSTLKTTQQTGSQQAQATGQQNNGQKATGSVVLSAGTCGPNFPSDVPAGAGISTNGLTYITQGAASFNAKNSGGHCVFQSNSVSIAAQQAGSKYNTSINGASVSRFSGDTADGSASGGTDNIVTVVSQQDVNNAKQKIASQNSDDVTKKFEGDLTKAGYYVLTSTMKVSEPSTTASPVVGQQASTVTVTTQVTYSVLVVQKDDLKQAITDKLNKQVDTKKQRISSSDVVKDASITVGNQKSPTDATLTVNENTTAIPIIDEAGVKQQAAGQKVGDIKAILNGVPGVEKVDVKLSPFWVSKAPNKTSRIIIELKQVKAQ